MQKIIKAFSFSYFGSFLFYILLAFIAYYKIILLSFLSDDWGLINSFDKYGWNAIFHNFDIPIVFRPVSFFLSNIIYELWGIASTIPYHSFSIIIHSFNSYLVFLLFISLNVRDNIGNRKLYAYCAGVLFLLLPYQSEAVSWIAASADLLATMFCLLSFIFYLRHKSSNGKEDILYSLLFFFAALLSKESSWFFPLLIGLYELSLLSFEKGKIKDYKRSIKLLLGFLLCFSVYIILRYLCLGAIFKVYGKAVHMNFDFFLIIHNYILYFTKFFLFYRLLPEEIKLLLKFLHNHFTFFVSLIPVLILIIYIFYKRLIVRVLSNKDLIFSLIYFIIALIPVINLETSFLGDSQSDRYGYLPSVFFVLFIITFMQFIFKNRKIFLTIVSVFAVCFFYCLQGINENWKNASKISESVMASFSKRKENGKEVYILNMPDNYNGAYLFRNGFKQAVSLTSGKKLPDIKIISYHNINQINDSIKVERRAVNEYSVKLQSSQNSFLPMNSFTSDDSYQITDIDSNSFTVRFSNQENKNLYYYTEGQLYSCDL